MSKSYKVMSQNELMAELKNLQGMYNDFKENYTALDMTRGKPCKEQLDLSKEMLSVVSENEQCMLKVSGDCRNYGCVDGLQELKELFGELFNVSPENIIIGGNSSLSMMYDTIMRAYCFGFYNSERPWKDEKEIEFLCPVPGYDRHFKVTETFGFQMINIDMDENGPDVGRIKELVENDASIKGIWCVPKYSNPTGIVYSDEVVRGLAALKPKAKDFKIMWDNAYAVHHLYDSQPEILNILSECERAGNEDMPIMFGSTSKITYAGSGIAMMAASKNNIDFIRGQLSVQTIGPDKLNQLRHLKYFKNKDGIIEHMKKHADILRPKFEAVVSTLEKALGGLEIASWSNPLGGYFVSLDVMDGCAKRVCQLCADTGVKLTNAGATYPYGKDPLDRNIRIAPSFPTIEELTEAMRRLVVCVKLASVEKLLK